MAGIFIGYSFAICLGLCVCVCVLIRNQGWTQAHYIELPGSLKKYQLITVHVIVLPG